MGSHDPATRPSSARTWLSTADLRPLLVVPIVVFELVAFVAPFLMVLRTSLYETARFEPAVAGSLTLANYGALLTDPYIHGRFLVTLEMTLVATAVTLTLGTYFAYAIWRSDGWLKALLLVAVILPLLTTLVVKLYAWVLLLAPLGTLNDVLIAVGVIETPLILMNNRFGAVVGLVYVTLPYTVLPVYAVIETVEWETVEAARVHGAGELRSFREVVLPAAVPGIIVALVLTLVWNFGAFAAPGLLGSGREITLAMEIGSQPGPTAAALALLMFALLLLTTIALFNLLSRWAGGLDLG